MNHYTYLLQSQTSDMMYIGVRSCECGIEEDKYYGSSKYLPEDVSETFDKFILGRFDTREEAVADEIHRHKMNDVAKNPLFINKSMQTSTGFDTSGITFSREDTSSYEGNTNGFVAGFVPWNKGKKGLQSHSEERINQLRKSMKGNQINKGKVWVNDGAKSYLMHKEEIPEGYFLGRTKYK